MSDAIEIRSGDAIIQILPFKPYQNAVERRATKFEPGPDEAQSLEVRTPWGQKLNCNEGDYIVSELDEPEDRWPVNREIFEKTYQQVRPGHYVKSELVYLVPLVEITRDEDQRVIVYTLEGPVEVRAGDFYLARGAKGEIWPFPKEKVRGEMSESDSS